jgi:hypothetical protein
MNIDKGKRTLDERQTFAIGPSKLAIGFMTVEGESGWMSDN